MKLEDLIARIAGQQKRMGYTAFVEEAAENRMDYLRDTSLALIIELVEMLQHLPWKPWKPVTEQPLNMDKAESEYSDVLVFAIVIMLTINPFMNIGAVLRETLEKIDKRIEANYGKQEQKQKKNTTGE